MWFRNHRSIVTHSRVALKLFQHGRSNEEIDRRNQLNNVDKDMS
jgi:hypothetical protein